MDIRKVKKLIELLEESNIDELEIKEGEESVRISRNSGAAAVVRGCPRRERGRATRGGVPSLFDGRRGGPPG